MMHFNVSIIHIYACCGYFIMDHCFFYFEANGLQPRQNNCIPLGQWSFSIPISNGFVTCFQALLSQNSQLYQSSNSSVNQLSCLLSHSSVNVLAKVISISVFILFYNSYVFDKYRCSIVLFMWSSSFNHVPFLHIFICFIFTINYKTLSIAKHRILFFVMK